MLLIPFNLVVLSWTLFQSYSIICMVVLNFTVVVSTLQECPKIFEYINDLRKSFTILLWSSVPSPTIMSICRVLKKS